MVDSEEVLGTFFGDQSFPVEWESEEEKKLHWYYDDMHCPNPISPMYFSIGGWWGPTCEYMYQRFGAPFGKEWLAKKVNGYVYSTVVPRAPEEAARIAPYYNMVMNTYAKEFLGWWQNRYLPEIKRNFAYLDNFPTETATLPELMIHLEEALDIQERHFRLHWILNLAQFQASMDFNAVVTEIIGEVDPALLGRILISIKDRNWDAIDGVRSIVASNLFGDIITDLGAMLQGGMGFAAGGNINPEKTYPSMFEPIHGSAPKYAGKAVVNPVASIEAIRMMLEHLGEEQSAQNIQKAVMKILASGEVRTYDMGGTHKTHELGDAIRQTILS